MRHAVAAAATTAVGAGTAALAAGRYGSGFALKPAVAGPAPEGLVTVHRATRDRRGAHPHPRLRPPGPATA